MDESVPSSEPIILRGSDFLDGRAARLEDHGFAMAQAIAHEIRAIDDTGDGVSSTGNT